MDTSSRQSAGTERTVWLTGGDRSGPGRWMMKVPVPATLAAKSLFIQLADHKGDEDPAWDEAPAWNEDPAWNDRMEIDLSSAGISCFDLPEIERPAALRCKTSGPRGVHVVEPEMIRFGPTTPLPAGGAGQRSRGRIGRVRPSDVPIHL